MTGPSAHDDRTVALSALAWLVDAGIDTLVEAQPQGWLTAPVTAPPDVVPPPPARAAIAPVAARTVTAADAAFAAALAAADTLPALAAAVAAWRGAASLFAGGNPAGGVMVVGAMPSADDVAAGTLFAGVAGRLLDRMLAAIGRGRADTYLANVLHWPTPGARGAEPDEIAEAVPIIHRHIALARPRALLVLGGPAAAALLGLDRGINRLRGQWQTLRIDALSVPVLPSFHPHYLLAHPAHKALAWRDLQVFEAALSA